MHAEAHLWWVRNSDTELLRIRPLPASLATKGSDGGRVGHEVPPALIDLHRSRQAADRVPKLEPAARRRNFPLSEPPAPRVYSKASSERDARPLNTK